MYTSESGNFVVPLARPAFLFNIKSLLTPAADCACCPHTHTPLTSNCSHSFGSAHHHMEISRTLLGDQLRLQVQLCRVRCSPESALNQPSPSASHSSPAGCMQRGSGLPHLTAFWVLQSGPHVFGTCLICQPQDSIAPLRQPLADTHLRD